MKTNLEFDFSVDQKNKTIHVTREFDADVKTVWNAWTSRNLLEKWWAPKPWVAETKSMDFREGGYWLYAMVSPEGEKHWSMVNYLTIENERLLIAKDGFCDENGTINSDFPQNIWRHEFENHSGRTAVNITLTFDNKEDLEKIIEMGFKEGFTMGLNQLDSLLETLKTDKNEK